MKIVREALVNYDSNHVSHKVVVVGVQFRMKSDEIVQKVATIKWTLLVVNFSSI